MMRTLPFHRLRSAQPLSVVPAFLIFIIAGCGDGEPTGPEPRVVSAIAVAPGIATIFTDASQQFTATVTDQNGVVMTGQTVTWSSSDGAVATIDTNGLATAMGTSTSTITAAIGGISGSAVLTVDLEPGIVTTITVAPANATILTDATQQFTATVSDQHGAVMTGQTVTWSSSDVAVATVDGNGLVTGASSGTAGITAAIGSVSGSAALIVNAPVTTASWQPMGSGMNNQVFALTPFAGEVVAGGAFTFVSGQAANYVARWTGSGWTPIEPGLNGSVHALTVHDGSLIAGSNHSSSTAFQTDVSAWNGTEWTPMGGGMKSRLIAFAAHGGALVAGGSFTTAGEEAANYMARWDGSVWGPMGTGTNGAVVALAIYQGDLIAAGGFTSAGGQTVNFIARWDGSDWHPMGGGMNHYVLALTIFEDELIAAGGFTSAGGQPANRVARWNGSNWQPVGSGIDGYVEALTVFEGGLIAGGWFTTAAGETANHIARWVNP